MKFIDQIKKQMREPSPFTEWVMGGLMGVAIVLFLFAVLVWRTA